MDGYKAMAANLEANAHHTRLSTVFEDFVEMFALTLRNATDRQDATEWQAREETYLAIADRYDRKALDRFAETIALVTIEMANRPADVLGRLYMELELGNGNLGQFFTPYDIARLIAAMNVGGLASAIEADGQAAVYEPACGAGAFLIATVDALRNHGSTADACT